MDLDEEKVHLIQMYALSLKEGRNEIPLNDKSA